MTDTKRQMKIIFEPGSIQSDKEPLPLQIAKLACHIAQDQVDVADSLYEDGFMVCEEVCSYLKTVYLGFIARKGRGMEEARKEYRLLAYEKPYCQGLHKSMIDLELAQNPVNYKTCELPYKLNCKQFGKENVQVWIDCVNFYLDHYRGGDILDKIQGIFNTAERTLRGELADNFRSSFQTLMKLKLKKAAKGVISIATKALNIGQPPYESKAERARKHIILNPIPIVVDDDNDSIMIID